VYILSLVEPTSGVRNFSSAEWISTSSRNLKIRWRYIAARYKRTRNRTCLLLLIGFKEYGAYTNQVHSACIIISKFLLRTDFNGRNCLTQSKGEKMSADIATLVYQISLQLKSLALWMRDSRLIIAKNASILHQLLLYFILLLRFDKRRSIRAVQIYLMYDTPFILSLRLQRSFMDSDDRCWWSLKLIINHL
jgi:hypothetical protein